MIGAVIRNYFPSWEEPEDTGHDWIECCCPFHGEDHASASVSFEKNAFKCHACEASGDVIKIIRTMEEVTYQEAVERAKELAPDGDTSVLGIVPGKSRGRVASPARAGSGTGNRTVRPRVRG